jgi:hypothetical protein
MGHSLRLEWNVFIEKRVTLADDLRQKEWWS